MTPQRFKQLREDFSKTGPVAECLDEIERLTKERNFASQQWRDWNDQCDQLRATTARLAAALLEAETHGVCEYPDYACPDCVEDGLNVNDWRCWKHNIKRVLTPDALDDLRVIREAILCLDKTAKDEKDRIPYDTITDAEIMRDALKERFGGGE